MATSVDQSTYVKTALRLPPELHAAVHESAKKAGRSYNAELVFLIEKALTLPRAFIPAPASYGAVDEQGVFTSRGPKELMAALAEKLGEAYRLAQVFKVYEDGEPEPIDLSSAPDWVVGEPDEVSLPPVKKVVRRSRKPKP